jgi:GNAT superfamily N-acetyltransferase
MAGTDDMRELLMRLYDSFNTGDPKIWRDTVAEDALGVGSDPDEWWDGRAVVLRIGETQVQEMGAAHVHVESGTPKIFEQGDVFWAVDRPSISVPGGHTDTDEVHPHRQPSGRATRDQTLPPVRRGRQRTGAGRRADDHLSGLGASPGSPRANVAVVVATRISRGIERYGSQALVRSLAVVAAYQGRGIGTTLLRGVIEEARERGAATIGALRRRLTRISLASALWRSAATLLMVPSSHRANCGMCVPRMRPYSA